MDEAQLLNRVRHATHFNRKHLDEWIANAERAWLDSDRDERRAGCLCRWCFYAVGSRIGGAAMTTRKCDSCGEDQMFASTATDPLCRICAERLGLCKRCGGDVEMANRTKLERAAKPRRR